MAMVRWGLVLLSLAAVLAVDAITITIRQNHPGDHRSGYHSRMEATQEHRQNYGDGSREQYDQRQHYADSPREHHDQRQHYADSPRDHRQHYGDNSHERHNSYPEQPKQHKVATARAGMFPSVYGTPYSYGPGHKVVLIGKLGKLGLIAGIGKLGALGAITHLLKLGALGGLIGLGKLGTLGALLGFGKVGLLGTLGAAHVAKNLLHKGHVHVVIHKRNDEDELLHYVDTLPNPPHDFAHYSPEHVPIGGYAKFPSARGNSLQEFPERYDKTPYLRQGFAPHRNFRIEERRGAMRERFV